MPIVNIKGTLWDIPINKESLDNEKNKLYFGSNVYYLRKYRGISQDELATRSSTTQRIISEIEGSLYDNPGLDLINKLAESLGVDNGILTSKTINWRLIEIFDYYMKKYGNIDILKAVKIAYFIDLEYIEEAKRKFTGLNYYRYKFGPFNKDLYKIGEIFDVDDENIFSNITPFRNYIFLGKEEQKFLDKIFTKYGNKTGIELMKMSYDTEPMKKLGATLGGVENMNALVI